MLVNSDEFDQRAEVYSQNKNIHYSIPVFLFKNIFSILYEIDSFCIILQRWVETALSMTVSKRHYL